MNDNTLTIVGRLTRDPELRFTTGGHAVCSFGIAWAPRKKDPQTGEWGEGDTSFYQCTAWRKLGENIAGSLSKGNRVIVVGTVSQRKWTDKEGGERVSTEIDVAFCGPELTWDQAEVVKAERSSGSGRQRDPIYGEEEPF